MKNITRNHRGFTITEIMVALVIFPLILAGMVVGFESINQSYKVSKEYNEMYAVLSACPEIDRALEYNSLTSSSNCYPNNIFQVEGGGTGTLTYTPDVDVTDTSALTAEDPLQAIPDSKVVKIDVPFLNNDGPPLELRMLITRNGIGQL